MDFKFQRHRLNKMPESKILEELEKAAKHFNYIEFGRRDFGKIASISSSTVIRHYDGSWTKGLKALKKHLQQKGLDLSSRPHAPNRILSDKDLFDEMERIWQKVGQRPSRTEWEISDPKISYNTYQRRFGGWGNTCLKFIEFKMGGAILADDFVLPDREDQKTQQENKTEYKKENSRNVSLSLRLAVLSKDNFHCVFCGKSPATDLGTKLHIDHMEAFSKGGKSTLENLQTLCEECNLGKSNKNIILKKRSLQNNILRKGGHGGEVFIITEKISGDGSISADGGDGDIGGNAGKVHIESKVHNFTGKVSARGGKAKSND